MEKKKNRLDSGGFICIHHLHEKDSFGFSEVGVDPLRSKIAKSW